MNYKVLRTRADLSYALVHNLELLTHFANVDFLGKTEMRKNRDMKKNIRVSCSARSWPQQHPKIVVVCGFSVALSETGSRPAGGISWRRVGNLAVRGPVGLKCLTSGPEFYSLTSFSEDCPPKRGYIWIFLTTKNATNWQILLKRNFPALVPHWKVQYFLI